MHTLIGASRAMTQLGQLQAEHVRSGRTNQSLIL